MIVGRSDRDSKGMCALIIGKQGLIMVSMEMGCGTMHIPLVVLGKQYNTKERTRQVSLDRKRKRRKRERILFHVGFQANSWEKYFNRAVYEW